MRKTLLTASLFLLAFSTAFAQKSLVNKAWSQAKMEEPNFKQARADIQEALANEETFSDAKTWYVAGNIEQRFFDKENSQLQLGLSAKESEMYSALSNGYKYYLKAVALDTLPNKKGKVKPKHLKNIRKDLLLNSDGYIQGGVYYFNQKEYKKAYDIWDIFLQIRDLPFMATEADKMPADSIYAMLEFNSALAAIQTGDHDMAIEALNRAKGNGYSQNDVYKYLVSEYEITKDTANLIATLQEGNELFKNEMIEVEHSDGTTSQQKETFYSLRLVNLYIFTNQYEKALGTIDAIIANDPENPELWNVKGQLYETEGNIDEAIKCFEKAIAVRPDFAAALGNLGRMYFNSAIEKNNRLSESIVNTVDFNKAREAEVLPLYRKALPYYEKAHSLDPQEREYMVALRGIYYNLNDAENLTKIEAEMGY